MDPVSQWLFIVMDQPDQALNISSFSPLIGEGENIAFMYNVTDTQSKCRVSFLQNEL